MTKVKSSKQKVKMETEKGMTVRPSGKYAVAVLTFLLSTFYFLLFTSSAAEPTTRPSEKTDSATQIRTWFGDLASREAAVRQDAEANLMGMGASSLPALQKAVEESRPILPSQAMVLRKIVTQVFLSGVQYDGNPTEGFLGIRMEEARMPFNDDAPVDEKRPPITGVVIVERMPGFAGARVLRDGDVVLGIEEFPNTPFRRTQDFAVAVKDKGAGTVLHFQVLRHGQVIRLAIKLDPRPFDANFGFGGTMDGLLEQRRIAAEEYWDKNFAMLLKEKVS
ncbi:MAG: hypothetical protein JWM97_932 [Phycisphaerales bacterium]|nr:hypothetical protein [Phycisphaerales bacterium]